MSQPRTLHSVAVIAGSSAVGQLAAFAGTPVIARIYSPAEFGRFAVVTAAAAVIGSVGALRLDTAIPLPEKDSEAQELAETGLMFALTLMVLGAVAVVAGLVARLDTLATCGSVVTAGGAMTFYQVTNQYAIRQLRFKAMARRNALQPLVMIGVQLLLGVLGLLSWGLILGFTLAYAVSGISLLSSAGLRLRLRFRWSLLVKYRKFPLYLVPSGLLNTFGQQMPVLIVAYVYTSTVAGWFGLTQKSLAVPVALMGTAVAQVYLANASRVWRDTPSQLSGLFDAASKRLALAGSGLLILVVATAPWLFPTIMGRRWAESGIYAAILAPAIVGQLVASTLSQTLIIVGRQRTQLAWDAGRVVCLCVAGLLSRLWLGPTACVVAVSVVLTASYAVLWWLNTRAVHQSRRRFPQTRLTV